MDKRLATIAMTAFNAQDTIDRALASARAQDYRPIEIVVVDDASTDGTIEKIEAHASMDPRIRIVRHGLNRGVASARNTLLESANGEFVIFFDDDDESAPNRVSAQIARIESYEQRFNPSGPVICHAARLQLMPDGSLRTEAAMGASIQECRLAPNGRSVAERVLTGRPLVGGFGALATCSQAARRSTYALVGGFDPAFRRSEDTDLSIRLALAGAHFVGIADPLVKQTITMSSDKTLAAELTANLQLIDKHKREFGSARAYHFARRWAVLKFRLLAGQRMRFARELVVLTLQAPMQTIRRLAYALPMSASRAARRLQYKSAAGMRNSE